MQIKKNFKLLNTIILLVMLTACTTVSYRYIPPSSESGRMCLNQCLQMYSQCRNQCSNLKLQHETLNSINRAVNPQDPYSHHSSFYESSCLANCEAEYRACYTNCGGYVQRIEQPMF